MSEGREREPEPFLSDFSFSVVTCVVLTTISAITANYVLALENKPVLRSAMDGIIWSAAAGYSLWQYRRFRRLRGAGARGQPSEKLASD